MADDQRMMTPYPTKDIASGPRRALGVAAQALDLAFPLLGTTTNAIVDHFIAEPLQDRRDAWFAELGEKIEELLNRRIVNPDDLRANAEFVTVVAEATTIAMRTHHEEKRQALLNATLNTAIGCHIDDVLRGVFMRHIVEFSGAHIRLLKIMSDPRAYPRMVEKNRSGFMGSVRHVVREEITDAEMSDPVFDRVVADLNTTGLMEGTMRGLQSSGSYLDKKTTSIGDAFLRFISSPLDAD